MQHEIHCVCFFIKNNVVFLLLAAVSEAFREENATGRFPGFISQLEETPTRPTGPGEETPGNDGA